jgi:MinD superfamily P-loop ATPase
MVETFTLGTMIELLQGFGPFGLVFVIWYFDSKRHAETLERTRRDTEAVLNRYQSDMSEQRRMYENNVELLKTTQCLAKDLKDVVMMNTQAWTQTADKIEGNQFCPMVRLKKKAAGPQEE